MFLGMGIVFTFLVILVFALHGMSRIARVLEGRHASVPAVSSQAEASQAGDAELMAVIGAAIARFRSIRH